jgi:hypothetical protein
LAPEYNVAAIISDVANLKPVLESLHPRPRGVNIGGGFAGVEAEEAKRIIAEFDDKILIVEVAMDQIKTLGPTGVAKFVKDEWDRLLQ